MLIHVKLAQLLYRHIHDYKLCVQRERTHYAGKLTLTQLFYMLQPHVALISPEAEVECIREWTQTLLAHLLPDAVQAHQKHKTVAESVQRLLREIITTVLQHALDHISKPDILFQLILNVRRSSHCQMD